MLDPKPRRQLPATVVASIHVLSSLILSTLAFAASLEVEVRYTGPGDVNDRHGLVVIVLDQPDLRDPTSRILAAKYLTENGAVAAFSDLEVTDVYVVAAYDQRGGYVGTGTIPGPLGLYGAGETGLPAPISLRPDTRVTLAFDDTLRLSATEARPAEHFAALESADGIVEVHIYKIKPGARDRFIQLFEENLGHQVLHGLRVPGIFRSLEDGNTFVWLRTFRDQEERLLHSRRHYFSGHWLNERRRDVAQLLESTEVLLLEPTELSSIR